MQATCLSRWAIIARMLPIRYLLTSCQPGSDTPGSPVGLRARGRPLLTQVRTITPP